jgi:hypothetical protein
MNEHNSQLSARMVDLDRILEKHVPLFFDPPLSRRSLKAQLDGAKIPKWKSNLAAKNGGGRCYYSLAHVEKLWRSRISVPAVQL